MTTVSRARTPPALTVEIIVQSDLWGAATGIEATVRTAIVAASAAVAAKLSRPAEVAVALIDDAEIRAMNRVWRGKDAPTNVLSFPAAPSPARTDISAGEPAVPKSPVFLGDIAISYETAAREAVAEGKPLKNHVSHLAIHGFLHLLGHDHEHEEAAEEMEALERAVLSTLGIPDPFAPA